MSQQRDRIEVWSEDENDENLGDLPQNEDVIALDDSPKAKTPKIFVKPRDLWSDEIFAQYSNTIFSYKFERFMNYYLNFNLI